LTRTQLLILAVIAAPLGGFYVIESFINPNPVARIVLRTAPVLPGGAAILGITHTSQAPQAAPAAIVQTTQSQAPRGEGD